MDDASLNETDKKVFQEICAMNGGQFPNQISREAMFKIAERCDMSAAKLRKVIGRIRASLRPKEPQVTLPALEASWRKVVK